MKIKSIKDGSIGSLLDFSTEDELLEINGHPVRDPIDYKFFSTDHLLKLKLKTKEGKVKRIEVEKQTDEDLGLEFYPIKYKSCNNNCIFCFVHQLPPGLRKSLYFKDEDFRLSFLHGNFITLTNTLYGDIKRIIHQRLSPLYISVHATDAKLREKMLSNSQIPDILPLIDKLAQGRIKMHTQIVLCPGINDGKHLQKSVEDLSGFYPYVESLALVPVGLTKFRRHLPRIQPVDKTYSRNIIRLVDEWQRLFKKKLGSRFVYAADELFIKAGLEIPGRRYYEGFYQVENGVGMMRQFLDLFQSKQKLLPKSLNKNFRLTLVTGASAFILIKQRIKKRRRMISGLGVQTVMVKNNFFGETVTVTGLLTGSDILNALRAQRNLGQIILLPPNCINQDGLFLDDLTPKDLEKKLGCKVVIGSYDLVESLRSALKEWKSGN